MARHSPGLTRVLLVALGAAGLLAQGCSERGAAEPSAADAEISPMDAGVATDDSREPAAVTLFLCPVPAPTTCPQPAPRYPEIAPIVERRCVGCHSGAPGGPWSLADYQDVADWWDLIKQDLVACTMPPADGGIAMTANERTAVLTWIFCGFLP